MAKAKRKKTKTPKVKNASPAVASDSAPPASRRFLRYCFVLALTGAVVLSWASLLSYSSTDPPSAAVYPPKSPVSNAAGLIGAYLAHGLRYWLGGGAYMGLLFASAAALVLMLGGRIKDMPWRVLGVILMVASASAALYMLSPTPSGVHPTAGVLGTGAGHIMLAKFGKVGGWLIVLIAACIGLVFSAESLVLKLPRLGRKVWDNRGRVARIGSLGLGLRTASETSGITSSPRPAAAVPAGARITATVRPSLPAPRIDAQPGGKRPIVVAKTSPKEKPRHSGRPTDPARRTYELPSAELLAEPSGGYIESQQVQAGEKRNVLQQTFNDFGVEAQVLGFMTGPVITLFEVSLAAGVKVSQISNLAADIARALAVPGVRIVSPLPGRDTVGIEVPNLDKEIVRIKELMQLAPGADADMYLPLYLGKDAGGDPIIADLSGMPHLLIAGTTGSGKSVCINAIIMSLLMQRTPQQVRFILIDPKMVEMAAFESIPHLLCPIVNDMRKAEDILEWAATKMDERYELLREAGVKNVAAYNRLDEDDLYARLSVEAEDERARIPSRFPSYVIIVDELADLMMTSGKEVEAYVIRIAQKARAVGIHLVLATQRPSVNVVTGLIKSNMPCRISFRVASRQESRIVLDQNGADVLLGRGDMLFLQPGTSNLIRAQGTYVDDSEVRTIVRQLRAGNEQVFDTELMRINSRHVAGEAGERDELFGKAVDVVLASQRGSVSLLQRRLQIGYGRASRIIDQMADAGMLGDHKGSQARECLITLEEWEAMKQTISADQSGASAADGEPTCA